MNDVKDVVVVVVVVHFRFRRRRFRRGCRFRYLQTNCEAMCGTGRCRQSIDAAVFVAVVVIIAAKPRAATAAAAAAASSSSAAAVSSARVANSLKSLFFSM